MKLSLSMSQYKAKCLLCPHYCVLSEGEIGFCRARVNRNGEVVLKDYGAISSLAVEPIEKKPFKHFLPGTKTLSVGGFSCNLRCKFCENHFISQSESHINYRHSDYFIPSSIIDIAIEKYCDSVCMTYNEPTIAFEYLMDIGNLCVDNNLKFIVKTNGYVNKEPWEKICKVSDSINLDWKGNADSYLVVTGAKEYVVLDRIKEAYESGVHIEISIPLHNQMKDEHLEEFGQFLSNISDDIPCHLLKIQSAYKHFNSTSNDRVVVAKDILARYSNETSVH